MELARSFSRCQIAEHSRLSFIDEKEIRVRQASFNVYEPPTEKVIEGRQVRQSTLYYVKVNRERMEGIRKRYLATDGS